MTRGKNNIKLNKFQYILERRPRSSPETVEAHELPDEPSPS